MFTLWKFNFREFKMTATAMPGAAPRQTIGSDYAVQDSLDHVSMFIAAAVLLVICVECVRGITSLPVSV